MVGAAGVLCGGAAVQGETDADPGGGQRVQDVRGEQGAVRLDGGGDLAVGGHRVPYRVGVRDDRSGAREQGLTAVQFDPDVLQAVRADVFADAVGGPPHGGVGGALRALAPTAVLAAVDVAVRAGQVAPAVHLEDELPEGHGPVAGAAVPDGAGRGTSGHGASS